MTTSDAAAGSATTPRPWKGVLALGVLTAVVGIILTVSVVTTAMVIVLLIAFALILAGIERVVDSAQARNRTLAVVVGVVGVVLGVIALVSPGLTLVALAFTVGIGLIVAGAAGLTVGIMARGERGAGWIIATGVLDIVVGVLALAWPGPTILFLCIVFGIRTILAGFADISYAMAVRRSETMGTTLPDAPSGATASGA